MNFSRIKPVLFIAVLLCPLSLSASGTITRYTSPTGLYEVVVPENYRVAQKSFRLGPKRVIYETELKAIQDQRPYKNSIKQHIIKTQQTLGTALTKEEKQNFIIQHLNSYVDFYSDSGGEVLERNNLLPNTSNPAGEIIISFDDPTLGTQNIQARILFTDVTKMEQILIASPEVLESTRSKGYFNSLIFNSGVTMYNNDVRADWVKRQSPLGIFSSYLPAQNDTYAPKEPKFFHAEKSEALTAEYFDPIWRHKLRYTIYGYDLPRNLSFSDAKEVLHRRHIRNFAALSNKMKVDEYTVGKNMALHTEFQFAPDPGLEYQNYVELKAQFTGNYMIVHEIVGSQDMADSSFIKNVMDQVIFHPGLAASIKAGH